MTKRAATVFVVDDDDGVRKSLRDLMEAVSLPVETFASGPEFLDAIDTGRAGCLLLDVRLKEGSGLEVQDKIRVTLGQQPELEAAVQSFGDYIREEVQALALDFAPAISGGSVLEFDDYSVPVQLSVATA